MKVLPIGTELSNKFLAQEFLRIFKTYKYDELVKIFKKLNNAERLDAVDEDQLYKIWHNYFITTKSFDDKRFKLFSGAIKNTEETQALLHFEHYYYVIKGRRHGNI